jgi:transposase
MPAMTTSTPLRSRRGGGRRRDIAALQQRRLAAADLFAAGATQAQVARELGVSPQSAHRWHARWKAGGTASLHAPARQGGPSKLTAADWQAVEQVLDAGAEAAGFESDLWTLKRVAAVIEQLTGVGYHVGHVWWLLRGHGWTPQRPIRRAVERDEAAITRWVARDWPRIQQTPASSDDGSSSRTSPGCR